MTASAARLPAYAFFALVLSGAGLPIYIFAPKFYAETHGLSLALIGSVLFGLRLIDVVQDPALGWVSEKLGPLGRGRAVWAAIVVMGGAMIGLFSLSAPIAPIWWFALTLTALFSAYSFLTISFYGAGVAKAETLGGGGHFRLAAWRETGGLLGVCVAAIAPGLLALAFGQPFMAFALGFAAVALLSAWGMAGEWGRQSSLAPAPFAAILSDGLARRLLFLALVNAAPLAVTSTLFLFFVESRLDAPGWEGPLLVLFFLSAAVSAPIWGRVAARIGAKRALLSAMTLAILSFTAALWLDAGQIGAFAVICVLSGASIGGDLTLLPAIFARRLAQIAPGGGQGFGLWGFVNKLSLALAAVVLLPLLESSGFVAGAADQPGAALTLLTGLYGGVPLGLKLLAMGVLVATDIRETT